MSLFGKRGPRGTKFGTGKPEKQAPAPASPAALHRPAAKTAPTPAPQAPKPRPAGKPAALAPAPPAPAPLPYTVDRPAEERMPAPRVLARNEGLVLKGEAYEALRLEVTRNAKFPRAFYAHSVAHGIAWLDPTPEDATIIGGHAVSLRHRVTVLWLKAGGVVIMHEGRRKLAAVVTMAETRPAPKPRKASRGLKK